MGKGLTQVFYWNVGIILLFLIGGWLYMDSKRDSSFSVSGRAVIDYEGDCLCSLDTSCDRFDFQVQAQECFDTCKRKKGFNPGLWDVEADIACPHLP